MPERPPTPGTPERPPTILEAVFDVIDTAARKIVDFIPLGRGIRNVMRSQPDGLIGWGHVREIAFATLELQRDKPGPVSGEMVAQYQDMLEAAQKQVADYTGLFATGLPQRVEVFRQQDWIDANITSFKFLFDPISDRYVRVIEEAGQGQAAAAHRVAHTVLSVQVGVIMGYLARNVLGQYDLSLPEPERGGKLYVVETNVARVERDMHLHPREFRQWITLHEVTHSFEFHSNDWLREHLAESMQDYLKTIEWRGMPRPDLFRGRRSRNVSEDEAVKLGGLLSMMSSPEQRKILSHLQAVMCVLEGYSNHVMDAVGKELLGTYESMKERFEHRRDSKSGAERLFQRLIGLELKMQQYKLGQQFVDAVVEAEGLRFLNRVWQRPANMPDMDEIRVPDAWIVRMKGGLIA